VGDVRVTVNGEARDVPRVMSIAELLVHLGLTEGPVAVELNRAIIPRAEHGATEVKDGDVLEIVHMVGGG
jgi:thiamine biosynthesis protein ThiS